MKHIVKIRHRIPRWVRAVLNLALAPCLTVAVCIALGYPDITMRLGFRRAEKLNLTGPGKIVAVTDMANYEYQKLLIAETEHGIEFYTAYGTFKGEYQRQFSYQPKTGRMTVAVPPKSPVPIHFLPGDITLPVFLFHNCPEAVRGEIDLEISGTVPQIRNGREEETEFSQCYHLESISEHSGYFCFPFAFHSGFPNETPDSRAAEILCRVCDPDNPFHNTVSVIPCTVRLYDKNDRLIDKKTMLLQSCLSPSDTIPKN